MSNYRKLGRESSQRQAMLRALTTSLIANGKIVTTEARAKEVRKQAEKLIALAVREKEAGEGEDAKEITYVVLTDEGKEFVPSED